MKKISIVGSIVIVLCFLFFLGSKIGTQYDIRYRSDKFKMPADKKEFQSKIEKYLVQQGYKKINKNPSWALVSFGDENKRKISFYANTIDNSSKSIFYLEDGAFDDKILIIMYIYTATSHPLFIDSKNEKMHKFGLGIAEKFHDLTVESDSYKQLCSQK